MTRRRATGTSPRRTHPCHGPDRELERLLSQQNRGMRSKPILEINLRHPLVSAIASKGSDKKIADDLSLLLLEQAQILDGELPEDPAAFAKKVHVLSLGVGTAEPERMRDSIRKLHTC